MANSSGIDKHSKLQTIFRFFGSSSVSHLKYPKLIGFILHFSFFWWDRFIPQNLLLVGQLPPCQCCSSLHCRGIDIIIGCQNEENCFVHLYFAPFHWSSLSVGFRKLDPYLWRFWSWILIFKSCTGMYTLALQTLTCPNSKLKIHIRYIQIYIHIYIYIYHTPYD